jgi:hypothetical protein
LASRPSLGQGCCCPCRVVCAREVARELLVVCDQFLRRINARCTRRNVVIAALSALAHRHAVAFLLIVAFNASNSAAMAVPIAIVAIIVTSSC